MVDGYVDIVPRVEYDGLESEVQQYLILRLQRTTKTSFADPEPRLLHLCLPSRDDSEHFQIGQTGDWCYSK